MNNKLRDKIQEAKRSIDSTSKVVALTGAGISAESGIPTFRGKGGLWKNFRPEDIATPRAFREDPKFVWEWYDWRRGKIKGAKPNPGHLALAELETQKPLFTLITQNIDGLHGMAGNGNIIEMHGNIWEIKCTECEVIEENHTVPLEELPPKCPECGGIGRPNVVWFGERIPAAVIDKSLMAIEECEVMLIVGTSGVVEPAASMGLVAKQTGKTVIEVNLDPTPNSDIFDISIRGKAGEILPQIYKSIEKYS